MSIRPPEATLTAGRDLLTPSPDGSRLTFTGELHWAPPSVDVRARMSASPYRASAHVATNRPSLPMAKPGLSGRYTRKRPGGTMSASTTTPGENVAPRSVDRARTKVNLPP